MRGTVLILFVIFALPLIPIMASAATVPTQPVNPSATAVSPTQINLFWSPPSNDGDSPVTGYKIEYKVGSGQYMVLIQDTSSTATSYLHAGLTTGQSYHYRVSAINTVGAGSPSSEVSATPTSSSSASAPGSPTGLIATPVSGTQINLSWSQPANNGGSPITGYKIEYRIGSGSYTTLISNTASTSTTYAHAGLSSGTLYSYRILAINSVGTGAASNEASATTGSPASIPGAPSSLSAITASPTQINLSWSQPANNGGSPITGYKIEVKRNSDSYNVLVQNTHSTATTFAHSGLSTGSTYYYRVFAINAAGVGPASEASATAQETTTPVLTASPASPTSIRLSWAPPSQTYGQAITGYKIEEQVTANTHIMISETTQTSYLITGLTTGKPYSYIVTAHFTLGSSPPSNVATATPSEGSTSSPAPTTGMPPAPTALTATVVSLTQIDLSWSPPGDGSGTTIIGYQIEVRTGSDSYSALVSNTQSQSTAYSHTNLAVGTTYTYRVSAINSAGISAPSNEVSATPSQTQTPTTAPAPPILTASLVSPTQVNLSWSPQSSDSSITGYKIEYKVGTGQFLSLHNNLAITSYQHTGLFSNTYTYRVYAVNTAGSSLASNEVSVSTVTQTPPPSQEPTREPESEPPQSEPDKPRFASFVDPQKDPAYYVNRYNNEPEYKSWFDMYFPGESIYEAVGLEDPNKKQGITTHIPGFPDPDKDPQYYVDRYNNEAAYAQWFDRNFPGKSIYQVLQLPEPEPKSEHTQCGPGTRLEAGVCVLDVIQAGGGCLVATAAYGSELAPQVQMLREVREDALYRTTAGTAFMTGFNEFYYSFSPTVADWQRANPLFKEITRVALTPLLHTLSILIHADIDSEQAMLGYGIVLALLNGAIYVGVPTLAMLAVKAKLSR